MGAVLDCPKHGYSGGRMLCVHLFDELNRDIFPKTRTVKADFQYLELCQNCYEQTGMERFEGISLGDMYEAALKNPDREDVELLAKAEAISKEYDSSYKQLDTRFYCVECFDEMRLQSDS